MSNTEYYLRVILPLVLIGVLAIVLFLKRPKKKSPPRSGGKISAAPSAPPKDRGEYMAEQRKREEEVLAKWGLTRDGVEEARLEANARNYRDGKYHRDSSAPYGSADNPETVGIPECSDDLRFSVERGHWILTDGLGNGWIR